MKKYIIFLSLLSIITSANGAVQRRGLAASMPQTDAATGPAHNATSARVAKLSVAPSETPAPVTTNKRTTVTRGASASQPTANKTVAARAATQKTVSTGTKVTAAIKNTAVDATCTQKFNGCMDSFCMQEDSNGGRCICGAQYAELTQQYAEIEALDEQSYKLATIGVETIETGVDITAIKNSQTKRKRIDLSKWNNSTSKNKTGLALQKEVFDICMEQIPECAESGNILRTMYNQQVVSDCAAYKNAIKEERIAAEGRLEEAKKAMRTSAYDVLQNANKYDLGQCTIEFKKCMIKTGGCGDDFKGCVGIAAAENTKSDGKSNGKSKNTIQMYDIQGSATKISIAASSYDTLESKKPLCTSVLNQCQNVSNLVWDTFLRDVAPQIKTAELLAESDIRTSCMNNISNCFVQACKDNMDPNNPDGSYDMCLSRPETVKSLCKVQIDPCISAEPLILDYVYARLAAMRVDSCTTEVKQCLQSDDRCGSDYAQCVGLDTDTIIRMCPYDKLVGCQKVYQDTDIRGNDVYDELYTMVQGIMLNIDNGLLEFCQNAANESMIRVCGDTENCNALTTDDKIGAGTLEYKICEYNFANNSASIDYSKCRTNINQITDIELGRVPGALSAGLGPVTPFIGLLDGMMFWELVTVDNNDNLTGAEEYFQAASATEVRAEKREQISSEIKKLQTNVNNVINEIESDPTVQYCMTGRKVQGMKEAPIRGTKVARFPQLTKQMRNIIATQTLKVAKENYYKVYDIKYANLMQDYVKIAERQAAIKGENAKDVRREAARKSCVSLADMASLPMSPPPPAGWGMWLVFGVVMAAAVVVSVLTFGAGSFAASAGASAFLSAIEAGATEAIAATALTAAVNASLAATTTAIITAGVVAGATAIGSGIAGAVLQDSGGNAVGVTRELSGHHELNQWNYKQVIDTTFEWDSLTCRKCTKSTKCIKQKYPLFGMPYCKQWAESTTKCTNTQF